jgi:hypothetical protein
MAEDIMAIDVMNYCHYFRPDLRLDMFSKWDWSIGLKSTFKMMGTPERMAAMGLPNFEALLKEMDETGYEKVILSGIGQWSWYKNEWVSYQSAEMVKEYVDKGKGKIVGGVGYNPLDIERSLRDIDTAIKDWGFKYIYFHPQGFNLPPNDRRYFPAYVKALEYDVPIGYQCGHSAESMPSEPGRAMYIDEVAILFPSLKIVMSHTGWPWVDEWIDMAWKHPNVYGDISAYPPRSLPEKDKYVDFMNSWRGEDKVLFGTNSLGLKACKEQFMELPIKEERKVKILRENAIKLFKL